MRLFLGFLLFDIIFRSFIALVPYNDWRKELEMRKLPLALPDPEEREDLARKTEDADHDLLTERTMRSFDSLWEFWKPWPSAESRKKMVTFADAGKFTLAWMSTRLDFLENLVHLQQNWTMFSPNVSNYDRVVRAQLAYEDGSEQSVRNESEPDDLLHYSSFRFLTEKRLQYTTRLGNDDDARRGYGNLLAHRYPRNEAGSPLKKVYLTLVLYDYPKPGEDARAAMEEQFVPLGKEKYAPFYVYDVATRKGRKLDKDSR
jgi:hypothetical protein